MPDANPADFELAREALLSITTADTIGEPAGSIDEVDGVTTVYFETTMRSYRGWRWTVSIAHVEGLEPSVLETELTPGDGALLSPDWVPWADRMADYRAAQAAIGEVEADDELDDDDDVDEDDDYGIDDLDDLDDDDDVDDEFREHDDVDGVDIDSVDADGDGVIDDDVVIRAGTVIGPRSATPSHVGVDEPDDSEGDADEAGPEPKVRARRASSGNRKKAGKGE